MSDASKTRSMTGKGLMNVGQGQPKLCQGLSELHPAQWVDLSKRQRFTLVGKCHTRTRRLIKGIGSLIWSSCPMMECVVYLNSRDHRLAPRHDARTGKCWSHDRYGVTTVRLLANRWPRVGTYGWLDKHVRTSKSMPLSATLWSVGTSKVDAVISFIIIYHHFSQWIGHTSSRFQRDQRCPMDVAEVPQHRPHDNLSSKPTYISSNALTNAGPRPHRYNT